MMTMSATARRKAGLREVVQGLVLIAIVLSAIVLLAAGATAVLAANESAVTLAADSTPDSAVASQSDEAVVHIAIADTQAQLPSHSVAANTVAQEMSGAPKSSAMMPAAMPATMPAGSMPAVTPAAPMTGGADMSTPAAANAMPSGGAAMTPAAMAPAADAMIPDSILPDEPPTRVRIAILNATGRTGGANKVAVLLSDYKRRMLEDQIGLQVEVVNVSTAESERPGQSILFYRPSFLRAALAMAQAIPGPQFVEPMRGEGLMRAGVDVEIVVGKELP
jgi:hypothetical protein